jgi:hypothetical protein
MSIANLSVQTLIHAGIELLVVGGLAFWVKNKTGSLDTAVDELNKKIAVLESAIERQQQILMQHEAVLRHLIGEDPRQPRAPSGPAHRPQSSPELSPPHKIPQGSPELSPPHKTPQSSPFQNPQSPPNLQQGQSRHIPQGQPQNPQTSPIQQKTEEPEIAPEELDEILDAELKKINQSSEIEIETTVPDQTNIKGRGVKVVAVKKKVVKTGEEKRGKKGRQL